MFTLSDLRKLTEAKQIGTVYHYTDMQNLHNMIHQKIPFKMTSNNGKTISTSRNRQLPVHNKHFSAANVRIALDGDKISEHHKISPIAGDAYNSPDIFDFTKNDNRIKRLSGEAEEAVIKHPFEMSKYIKHIIHR